MSDAWGPSGSPPPRPPPGERQHDAGGYRSYRATVEPRRSGAFRDVLIIAVLAVAGVVGIVIWDGGDVSEGTELEPSTGSLPSQDPVGAAAATGEPATLGTTQAVTTGTINPGDAAAVQAMVATQDALISVLPAPAGGTEQPPSDPGVRRWTFAGTGWQSIRDTYVATLRQQGFTVELQAPVNDGTTVGELYTLSDPAGTVSVQLTVGTSAGQSGIEVTRP